MAYTDLQRIANRYFDKGWSHSLVNQTIHLNEQNLMLKCSYDVVCSATIRIQLPDGTFHEDTAFAGGTGDRVSTIILAQKQCVFEAMKNTMSWFGTDIANQTKSIHFINSLNKNSAE